MEKAWVSLFGARATIIAKIIWLAFILIGSYSTLGFVWDLADTCNGLIIIPNLIALAIMAGEIVKLKDEYYAKELPIYLAEKKNKK